MECPFQVGDEVVCVDDSVCALGRLQGLRCEVAKGSVHKVAWIAPDYGRSTLTGRYEHGFAVGLSGLSTPTDSGGFDHRRFRKVQKPRTTLSIESFLTIKPGQFEEPRRAPAKTPEKADV